MVIIIIILSYGLAGIVGGEIKTTMEKMKNHLMIQHIMCLGSSLQLLYDRRLCLI